LFSCLASEGNSGSCFLADADISSNESTIDCCETVIAVGKKEGFNDPTKACNVAIKTLQDNMPHRYQIIGDNLYMQINVKQILPSCDDIAKLKNDFLPLWTRVVVNQLKEFGVFKSSFQVPMNTVTLCNSHHVR
jgi:hypothetical protein